MEVKIKNNNEMIDATIEMVDGVMVVSPKGVKWKPRKEEYYYAPSFDSFKFDPHLYGWVEDVIDCESYNMGWCFKTEQECREFCNRLNEAISQVKP